MTPPTLRQRLRGLAATLVILLLVAGVPFLLVAIGAAPWNADLGELGTTALQPRRRHPRHGRHRRSRVDRMGRSRRPVVLEVISQVRGLPAPSLPGLGGPQRAAGQLVAVAALLFVAAPTILAAFPTPPAHAAAAAPVLDEALRPAAVEAAPVLSGLRPSWSRLRPSTRRPSTTRSSVATACGRSPNGCSATAPGSPRSSS